LKFISVDFLDESIPQDFFWLTKYFDTAIKQCFLRYFICFRSAVHFPEHSGFICSERYCKKMKSLFLRLERKHAEAKSNLDFEAVAEIEMGRAKLF